MTDRHVAYLSPAGEEWMLHCHPQRDVLADVAAALYQQLLMTRALGREYALSSGKPIWKLRGYDDLWESRVRERGMAFRQFFGFARINGQSAVVFIDGAQKNRAELPKHVLDAAARRVDSFIADLIDDPALQRRSLIQ
jgi:hypothetical protein